MVLHTPMKTPEYMKVHLKYFPKNIIQQYALNELTHNGYIYIKIKKGMYGLKQASVLVYQNLTKLLIYGGYQHIILAVIILEDETSSTIIFVLSDHLSILYCSNRCRQLEGCVHRGTRVETWAR